MLDWGTHKKTCSELDVARKKAAGQVGTASGAA